MSHQQTLLMQLGEHLGELSHALDRVANSQPKGKQDESMACKLADDISARIDHTLLQISSLRATTASEAAIQTRALSYFSLCDDESYREASSRLCYSLVSYLESCGGESREQWGGCHFMHQRFDLLHGASEMVQG